MNIKEYIESGILEAYMLGALPPGERARVEADIAQNKALAEELHALETALQQYAASQAKEPPAGLQEKIWNAIQSAPKTGNIESKAQKSPKVISFQPEYARPVQWKYAAMWIGLAGSLLSNILFWYQGKQQKEEKTALEYKMDTLRAQQSQLAALLGDYDQAKNMMADTGMQTIVMHTVVSGHPMAATLYWSKNKGEAYVAMEALPQPPRGMQYQLWVMQDGKPVDMGVLPNSMASTPAIRKVDKTVTSGQAFAISLEKEGGSPTPTMQNIYVMGKA